MTTLLRSCTKSRPCSEEVCERNCQTRTYDCIDNKCVPNDDGTGMLLSKCRENCFLKQEDNDWKMIYIILGIICGVIFILLGVLMVYYFFFAKQRRK